MSRYSSTVQHSAPPYINAYIAGVYRCFAYLKVGASISVSGSSPGKGCTPKGYLGKAGGVGGGGKKYRITDMVQSKGSGGGRGREGGGRGFNY